MNEDKLFKLKNEGHELLDIYQGIMKISYAKCYLQLKERMKGKSWHFGQMTDEQDIKLAIGQLKKMIAKETYQSRV